MPSTPEARRARRAAAPKLPANVLPDDGIMDEIAVRLAVSGARVVRLTEPERAEAIRRMIASGADTYEIACHLGTSAPAVAAMLPGLGYRLKGTRSAHRYIVRADQATAA